MLAAVTLLAPGVLVFCIPGLCCPIADEPAVHATMPCCEGESSMASREPDGVRLADFSAPQIAQPATPSIAITAVATQRLMHVETPKRHGETSPPLFLLNEQFLI